MGIKVGSQQSRGLQPTTRQVTTPPNTNIRVSRPAPGTQGVRGMPTGIRVRKPEMGPAAPTAQANMLTQQRVAAAQQVQQMQQQGLAGNAPVQASAGACISCGTPVTPKVDRLFTRDGKGPFCPNCWAHAWIPHKFRNIDNGPACNMGVRFTDPEWRAIQTAILDTMKIVGGRTGRFPTPQEMDVILGEFKFSQVCATCKGDIAYALDSNDIKIAGVTPGKPWPQDRPVPWAMR